MYNGLEHVRTEAYERPDGERDGSPPSSREIAFSASRASVPSDSANAGIEPEVR